MTSSITSPAGERLLAVRDLHVRFAAGERTVHAVRGADLDLHRGEIVGIVGESGSGKSALMQALLGLLGPNATVAGSARLGGTELIGARASTLRTVRGGRIGMVFQDPLTSLNPVLTVGHQLAETIELHQPALRPREVVRRVHELLERVAIADASRRATSYPHELSGGMRQRVMIAIAIANDPDVIIADEPTTALDVTIQAQVLDVLVTSRRADAALVMITHDLGVVAGAVDRVNVMYGGRIVERGDVESVFYDHRHPYTAGLLGCLPRLDQPARALRPIPGSASGAAGATDGCSFAPRCTLVEDRCRAETPALVGCGPVEVACHVTGHPAGRVEVRG